MGIICGVQGPPANAPGHAPAGTPVYCGNGNPTAVANTTSGAVDGAIAGAIVGGAVGGAPGALAGAAGGIIPGAVAGTLQGNPPGDYFTPVFDANGNQIGIWETYNAPPGYDGGYTQYTSFDGKGGSTTTTWYADGTTKTQFNPPPTNNISLLEQQSANGAYDVSSGQGDNVAGLTAIVGGYFSNNPI